MSLEMVQRYAQWKANVPLLYDWLSHSNLDWASLSVAWGGVVRLDSDVTKAPTGSKPTDVSALSRTLPSLTRTLYYSSRSASKYDESTGVWSGAPGSLFVAELEVPRCHSSNARGLARLQDTALSPKLTVTKAIVHPGEINVMRSLPRARDLVVTHSDSRNLFVWNTARFPADATAAKAGPVEAAIPDITLVGHTDMAPFALDVATNSFHVVSGGNDSKVLLWDLNSAVQSSLARKVGDAPTSRASTHVRFKTQFKGHEGELEGTTFAPGIGSSADVVASSCAAGRMLVFDARHGVSSVLTLQKSSAHPASCVDWSPLDNHALLAGTQDGCIILYDVRVSGKKSSVVTTWKHEQPIVSVQWSPHFREYFATSSHGTHLLIWNTMRDTLPSTSSVDTPLPTTPAAAGRGLSSGGKNRAAKRRKPSGGDGTGGAAGGSGVSGAEPSPSVVFCHAGHRSPVSDFQWCPDVADPWLVASVSDDGADPMLGGGTMHTWRMLDWVTGVTPDRLAELDAGLSATDA